MIIVAILAATILVALVGLFIGLFLGAAGKAFEVEVDEREVAVRAALPGNNCGGCGYPGCDGLAAAIAKGEAPVNKCPVGGEAVGAEIAKIMGQEMEETVRMAAFVKCSGTCEKARTKFDYSGVEDCEMVVQLPGGGPKTCTYGCLGFGSCVKACPFDAIHIVDGIAVVDREACKACGKCVAKCPRHLIELFPYEQKIFVGCSSHDKGKGVTSACDVGCIGCKKCEKTCPNGAITVTDFVAHIDAEKCTNCGACKEVCPRGIIRKEA
ncbi:MAG: RnfABCDGE type electron transport complex subunit B [Blautia sp.]|nr:RnfABCDGE type electron transport complex subunit B [Blautia sp.]